MSHRPDHYAGLTTGDKAVFELRRIGDTLENIFVLLQYWLGEHRLPEPEVIEPEPVPEPEPVEVKKRSIWRPFGRRGSKA